MFNIDELNMSLARDDIYLAEIEVPGQEKEDKTLARAVMLMGLKAPSDNHVVISEGLREKLGINQNDKIRILSISQDLDTLDLDKKLRRGF